MRHVGNKARRVFKVSFLLRCCCLIQHYQLLDLLLCTKMCPRHISMSTQPFRVDSQIHLNPLNPSESNQTPTSDLLYFKMVLRNDMEGAPDRREKGRECVEQPMASDSQSKIVAQARGSALAGKCSTRPAAEHTIWRSEMRLKRGRGGRGH